MKRATSFTIVSVLMMLVGLTIVGPSLVAGWSHTMVSGRLVEALPHELPNGDTQVQLVFEYPVRGVLDKPGSHVAIGWGRSNAFGQPIDDLTFAPNEPLDEFLRLRTVIEEYRAFHVFFDPDEPFESARIYSGAGLWRFQLGLLLVITPPLLWLSGRLGLLLSLAVSAWRRRSQG